MMTTAHTQRLSITVLQFFPAHEPRENDPHYAAFTAARGRLAKAGKLVCWVCGAREHIELHHALVEFALANGVDLSRFEADYPEFGIADEDGFLAWVESEGNLLPLCVDHHRGVHGVHVLPYPAWVAQRFWRADLPAPGVEVRHGS